MLYILKQYHPLKFKQILCLIVLKIEELFLFLYDR